MKKLNFLISCCLLLLILTYIGCSNDDGDPAPTGLQPAISEISPNEGSIFTELSITGTDFEEGAAVFVEGIESPTVVFGSATAIFALVPEGIPAGQALAVTVRNPGGLDATLDAAFTAIAPELNFVNSATKPSGNPGSTAIFEGKAFGSIQGASKIFFSDASGNPVEAIIASPDDWTDEFIVTTVPSAAADGPVWVETTLGQSNQVTFNVTTEAAFSPSAINWTSTTALPAAVSGHSAISASIEDGTGTVNQYVYVTGGSGNAGTPVDQVLYGQITATGGIASWTATTALPAATKFHTTIAATPFNSKVPDNGFLFAFGGIDGAGEVVSTVSSAPFNSNGTLGSWASETALPVPLHSLGAVIFRSTIYIAGGATTGNTTFAKVYKAEIDETGALGDWIELTDLPSGIAHHGFVTFGGFIYTVGGETTAVDPEAGTNGTAIPDVLFAKIDLRSGDITDAGWTLNANSISKERAKHTTLAVSGNIFVSSGLYAAANTGSSENTFAGILPDGTVDAFGGATGSNNLNDFGPNLFNQGGLSYIDANGEAHVMILGGDDVNNPGTKVANVLFY